MGYWNDLGGRGGSFGIEVEGWDVGLVRSYSFNKYFLGRYFFGWGSYSSKEDKRSLKFCFFG